MLVALTTVAVVGESGSSRKLADRRDTLMVKLTGSGDRLGVETKEREESRITLSFWHEKLGGLCCH